MTPEQRYEDLVDDFTGEDGVLPPPGGSGFGRGALRYRKKNFAMLVRGQGLAGHLIQSTLDAARERHLKVLPYCPYARRWIAEHPGYADLVPADRRPEFGL